MTYLLDTNVWVALLRQSSAAVSTRFRAEAPSGQIHSCSIVLAELRHGARRSAKPAANRVEVDYLLAPFPCLPFDEVAADIYSAIRHQLESTGRMIGPLDMLIAAIAIANDCTLITHNTSEFRNVSGLALEDWQIP
jgi:tRNA(fMet)-specific endonuclease VapC